MGCRQRHDPLRRHFGRREIVHERVFLAAFAVAVSVGDVDVAWSVGALQRCAVGHLLNWKARESRFVQMDAAAVPAFQDAVR